MDATVLKLNPKLVVAHNELGLAYDKKGDYDKAITEYTIAIKHTENAYIYYNRGLAYHHKGDLDKAIVDYTKALTLNSMDAGAYNSRGIAFQEKGDDDKADADFKKAKNLVWKKNM